MLNYLLLIRFTVVYPLAGIGNRSAVRCLLEYLWSISVYPLTGIEYVKLFVVNTFYGCLSPSGDW